MSGPKVVRIVTREEWEAYVRQLVAQLRAAIETWRRRGLRAGVLTQEEIEAVNGRLSAVLDLAKVGQDLLFQKQVLSEIAYLEADLGERMEKKARAEQEAKARRRQEQRAARQVLATTEARGIALDRETRERLEAVAGSRTLPAGTSVTAVLAEALTRLEAHDQRDGEADGHRRGLASDLADGAPSQSFDGWLAGQVVDKELDPKLSRADALVAHLEATLPLAEAAAYAERLARIEDEADPRRQAMQLDSFITDAARAVEAAAQRARIAAAIARKRAEVSAIPSLAGSALEERLAAGETNVPTTEAATALLAEADRLIEEENTRAAAAARRAAMLEGLASLGYEVHDGLATALGNHEPVVVRNPATPGYGVEITAPKGADKCQVRVVAHGPGASSRDTKRDKDIETQWCGDLDRLTALLAEKGSHLAIDRALPAGSTALKVVNLVGDGMHSHEFPEVTVKSARKLP